MSYLRTLLAGLAPAAVLSPLIRPADAVLGAPDTVEPTDVPAPATAAGPQPPRAPSPVGHPIFRRDERPEPPRAQRVDAAPPRAELRHREEPGADPPRPLVVDLPAPAGTEPPAPQDAVRAVVRPVPRDVVREQHTERVVVRETASAVAAAPAAEARVAPRSSPIEPLIRQATAPTVGPRPAAPAAAPRRANGPDRPGPAPTVDRPTVEVRIGRIVVRVDTPAPAAIRPSPAPPPPPTTLTDYLTARSTAR
ncbi:hypothetical protein [Pseudonocardia sp.]|uniref:hypothetical protein n=1 Tax=Pseudonocardia sp. TaxID=60912 RepID=UPI003D11B238